MASVSSDRYVSISCGDRKSFHRVDLLSGQNVGEYISQELNVSKEMIKCVYASTKEGRSDTGTRAVLDMPVVTLVRDFDCSYITVELEEDGDSTGAIECELDVRHPSALDVLMAASRSYDHLPSQK